MQASQPSHSQQQQQQQQLQQQTLRGRTAAAAAAQLADTASLQMPPPPPPPPLQPPLALAPPGPGAPSPLLSTSSSLPGGIGGGIRSPTAAAAATAASVASRSAAPSPQRAAPKFDAPLLRAYMKKLLASTLAGTAWPEPRDKDRVKLWCREIGERVKQRALEMEPRSFKFVVTTQINENLGQGGRADLVCHWEDTDAVAQEVFVNDSLICVCIAFAIRTA